MKVEKTAVKDFWDRASCGEELYLASDDRDGYQKQAASRYALEPYIVDFARFNECDGKRVLEIGVGLGADHQRFAESGAVLDGIDLTPRAISHTSKRLSAFGLTSNLQVADAESLPFPGNTFDKVYSWGVLHHSPDTATAVAEVHRVLKPDGVACIMIYHKYSMVGYMLWFRYGLLRLRPFSSLDEIYARHLESPGTKAYSVRAARELFSRFEDVEIHIEMSHGDLLTSEAGQRHRGMLLSIAKAIWPRRLIQRLLPTHGLFMLITARK